MVSGTQIKIPQPLIRCGISLIIKLSAIFRCVSFRCVLGHAILRHTIFRTVAFTVSGCVLSRTILLTVSGCVLSRTVLFIISGCIVCVFFIVILCHNRTSFIRLHKLLWLLFQKIMHQINSYIFQSAQFFEYSQMSSLHRICCSS